MRSKFAIDPLEFRNFCFGSHLPQLTSNGVDSDLLFDIIDLYLWSGCGQNSKFKNQKSKL